MMYSVVILDDEILAIQHLKRLLEVCALSCEVVATFSDARAALQELVCETADIFFVDIMMPTMDGLAFSERLLQRNSYAKIILLTAYRDFEYAKRAIDIGVHSYWVKHELRRTNIAEMMEGALAAAAAARKRKADQQRQRLFDALDEKISFSELLMINNSQQRCFLLYLQAAEEVKMEKLGLRDSISWRGCFSLRGLQVAAGSVCGDLNIEALRIQLEEKLPGFVKGGLLSRFFPCTSYSKVLHDTLLGAAENCVFSGRQILLAEESVVQWLRADASVPRELEKAVFEAADGSLRLLDAGELVRVLWPLWSNGYLLHGNRQALCYAQKRLDEYITAFGLSRPQSVECLTLSSLKEIYLEALGAYAKLEETEESPSFKVRRIRAYIHRHLQDDLQLRTLAREFSISGDYLRKIFRSEMGMTLSEYIKQARVEEAKRLLQTGDYRIYEIADLVGYHSTHYFSQVFQKTVGRYPTEYLSVGDHKS